MPGDDYQIASVCGGSLRLCWPNEWTERRIDQNGKSIRIKQTETRRIEFVRVVDQLVVYHAVHPNGSAKMRL